MYFLQWHFGQSGPRSNSVTRSLKRQRINGERIMSESAKNPNSANHPAMKPKKIDLLFKPTVTPIAPDSGNITRQPVPPSDAKPAPRRRILYIFPHALQATFLTYTMRPPSTAEVNVKPRFSSIIDSRGCARIARRGSSG